MIITDENYRAFPAVANSDLGWLYEQEQDDDTKIDLRAAYANGTLIDCMITEKHRVNIYTRRIEGEDYRYSKAEFDNARKMKAAADKDPFLQQMLKDCHFQHISYNPNFEIEHNGFKFELPVKCKWDLRHKTANLGGDIKSTVATTQKQCEAAFKYFGYDRSRAWYMDIEGTDNDIVIFISKKPPYNIFKIPIRRGDKIYQEGKKKYQELAYKWFTMFGNGK
jgi:hypothetical protein